MTDAPPAAARQPASFLWLYALAWAGGAVAYVPFLTILLPVRLAAMTGEAKVEWLAYISFSGAVAASVGGILFGWLSDRSGNRRPWIAAGLALTVALMLAMGRATGPAAVLALIVAWQLALNMMLGPLSAWAADQVPRDQLGTLGGLLSFAPALGSAVGALVTLPGLVAPDERLAVVAASVVACVLPALLLARPRPVVDSPVESEAAAPPAHVARAMWLGRLLVQISEAALFAYLYYYFRSIDPTFDEGMIARLFGIVLCVAVPLALLVGRWSDKRARPMLPLVASAAVAGVALLGLAATSDAQAAIAAYVVFGLATTVFLSLHSAQTLRVIRSSRSRGRDLGLFNLTNTSPSLIMPWLTLAIVPSFGFSSLFVLLAALAFAATAILARVGIALGRR